MNFEHELLILIKAKFPLIYIITSEEERLEYVLKQLSQVRLKRILYLWDFLNGFGNLPTNQSTKRNPFEALVMVNKILPETACLILFKDFNNFFLDIPIMRLLKDTFLSLRDKPKTVIFISNENALPKELQDRFVSLEFALPTLYDIQKEISRLLQDLDQSVNQSTYDFLCESAKGLSLEKIRSIISKSIATNGEISFSTVDLFIQEKRQTIGKTELLEFWTSNKGLSNIGGLEDLKSWLEKRKAYFSEAAQNYGLPVPKGLLLIGVQGTGKSMVAKAIAHDWSLPLLRLDTGRLFGGLVGESESRIREMIEITESLAPCILWIDEIEKSLAMGTGGDSGTTNRVISTFLTWLSEKKSFVFVVATANSLQTIQLELIRKGRFDEIFFLDLPNLRERISIFEVHLKEFRPETWSIYDLNELASRTNLFSGAEIRQLIIEAMYQAFSEKREFTSTDLYNEIDRCIPLAKIDSDSIQKVQSWVKSGRIRSGSENSKN
jgi:ATP-dependent 26S proteasome regulatory subunit